MRDDDDDGPHNGVCGSDSERCTAKPFNRNVCACAASASTHTHTQRRRRRSPHAAGQHNGPHKSAPIYLAHVRLTCTQHTPIYTSVASAGVSAAVLRVWLNAVVRACACASALGYACDFSHFGNRTRGIWLGWFWGVGGARVRWCHSTLSHPSAITTSISFY